MIPEHPRSFKQASNKTVDNPHICFLTRTARLASVNVDVSGERAVAAPSDGNDSVLSRGHC